MKHNNYHDVDNNSVPRYTIEPNGPTCATDPGLNEGETGDSGASGAIGYINKESNKKRIVFFVRQNLDSFLGDIISGLSDEYETKQVIVTNLEQISEEMKWADICWFEWCDELISYGSKNSLAKERKIICRLHSYEAFTDCPTNVAWENVDKIIFVAEHIKNFVVDKFNIDMDKAIVIPNGINYEKWTFAERKPGFNIAYVGYINYKKGPMLLLHTFKAIYDMDNRYKLFIAGQFQDDRDILYFNQMIKEFGIETNVIYEGWQNDLDNWLEDKNYILCTSILESQSMSIMQAMIKGIKPIIHNFVGAKNIYPDLLIWNTINDATCMVAANEYNSREYYSFIKNNFEQKNQIKKIKSLILSLNYNESQTLEQKTNENNEIVKYDIVENGPLVTIGITNYNGIDYLSKCVDSFINQTYTNIEILIIDDCSTDGSDNMIKNYEEKYKNVHAIYHSINSGGQAKGIQELISNAKGKYFQHFDCDDFPELDAISKFVDYLEKNQNKDYVFSDLNIVNENNVKVQQWSYHILSKNEIIHHIFKTASGLIPMNCLYKLSFFKDNKINWIVYREADFASDTLNFLQFIKYNWSYGKIDSAVINYKIHSNNLSYNLQKRINSSVSIFDYIIKNFNEEIYMPEVKINKFQNKKQLKNYLIAKFYYNQINNNINMVTIPQHLKGNVTKDELIEYCFVLEEEGSLYIDEGLTQGDTYASELLNLKELYNKYKEEVKRVSFNSLKKKSSMKNH